MQIYTDGSYNKKKNRKICGYGGVIINGEDITIIYGAIDDPEYVTMWNVGGELWAVIAAVDYTINHLHATEIDIYYDYNGVEKWVTGEWRAKNPITRGYKKYMNDKQEECKIRFHKVKAHSGMKYNELADKYANKGIELYVDNRLHVEKYK